MLAEEGNGATPWRFRLSPSAACVGLALLGAIGLVVVYIVDPRVQGNYPICPFLGMTGYHCPGCGTLRAIHQLLHGNILSALGYNPLALLSLPFIAYSFATGMMRAFGAKAPRPVFVPSHLIWALLFGVVAFWGLRNVPVAPLSALAP